MARGPPPPDGTAAPAPYTHTPMDPARLKSFLACGHACIRIVSLEEPEIRAQLRDVAHDLALEPWEWSATTGLRRVGLGPPEEIKETENAAAALCWLLGHLDQP